MTERIIGAAIEVHRHLGPGLLESVYEEALCIEMELQSVPYERQRQVDVIYKGHIVKGQRLDMLVDGKVVVELKAQSELPHSVDAQVLSYLHATGLKQALIINFGRPRLIDGIKRFVL